MSDGFWRLSHEDLYVVLARTDLSWETARVYLALADLTIGYGKEKDTVSLGQIADAASMDRPHVVRALKCLSRLGLYGQEKVSPQKVVRWVAWPPLPVARDGNIQGVAKGVAEAGSRTVAKGVAKAGTHQDTKKKDTKKNPARVKNPQNPGPEQYPDFTQAREMYPGTKRGLPTEFADFKRKHRDWQEILPLLAPAIENQIQCRNDKEQGGIWVPNWKHFKTWLNQRCWEVEESSGQSAEDPLATRPATQADIEQLEAEGVFAE